tara:strand:- start:257 stop:1075 length:819 start_codon:yes stop_codon:yes gene_type:complete
MVDENFSFSIDGKDYVITEKNGSENKNKNLNKNSQEKKFHGPSLAIGAIISGICIVIIFFGMENVPQESSELIERQMIQETVQPKQVTVETFFANGSPILGNPDAPITLIEFGDYQCHFCNVYYHNTEHQIFENYVMTGKINVIFKDYTIIGPDSVVAAHGAHCAGEQEMYWEFHNTLYDNWNGEESGWASQENIIRFAQENNLNINQFIDCNNESKYQKLITNSNSDAQSLGITGTPAFFIISKNSQEVQNIQGAQPYEVFAKIFDSMLEN